MGEQKANKELERLVGVRISGLASFVDVTVLGYGVRLCAAR
jgi:hypothetical protein